MAWLFRIYGNIHGEGQPIGEIYADSISEAVEKARRLAKDDLLDRFDDLTRGWTARSVENSVPRVNL